MSKSRMLLVIPIALAVLTAGAMVAARFQTGSTRELLFLGSGDTVTAVDRDSGAVAYTRARAMPSPDWDVLMATDPKGPGENATTLSRLDPSSGRRLATVNVPGLVTIQTVSPRGERVALMPTTQPTATATATGRLRTSMVIAGLSDTNMRALDIEGNIEPEAFSTSGDALFVIQYTPATAPETYRVRRLDISTGAIADVGTGEGPNPLVGNEDMHGKARAHAMAPDGKRLYTLYTDENRAAFVHVLDLERQWARCVDLPAPFAGASNLNMALTIRPDSRSVYVVDTELGAMATVDATTLTVLDMTTRLPRATSDDRPTIVTDGVGSLFVGAGRRLSTIDAKTLTLRRSMDVGGPISGLDISARSPSALFVGQPQSVIRIETKGYHQQGEFAVPSPEQAGPNLLGQKSVPLNRDPNANKLAPAP